MHLRLAHVNPERQAAFGKLPIRHSQARFDEHGGQQNGEIRYMIRGNGVNVTHLSILLVAPILNGVGLVTLAVCLVLALSRARKLLHTQVQINEALGKRLELLESERYANYSPLEVR